MTQKPKTNCFTLATLFALGLSGYALFLRKRLLSWGVTGKEGQQSLPGDNLIPNPNYQTTRAVLIHAAPAAIWPWLVQIGYQRGGFYSYDWLERQAGLIGLYSADQIVPEWQGLCLGDAIAISPITPLEVVIFEPERALGVHAVMNPFNGQLVDRAAQPESAYIDWSWAFILEPMAPNETRLLARVRGDFQPQPLGKVFSWLALEPVHFVMERKMLQGIKERAESLPV